MGRVIALQDSKGYCYASNSYLGENLGRSSTTVSINISKLVDKGYLERAVIRGDSKEVKERRLWVSSKILIPLPSKTKGGIFENENTPPFKNEKDRLDIKDKNIDNKENDSLIGEKTQRIIDKYNALFGKQCRVTSGRKKKLKTRLETYTLDEILQAIEKASKDKFYSGGNDRNWVLTLDYLLRNDENIDKLLNLETKSSSPKKVLT